MNAYFDLKAIPDPELLQSAIVAKLMQVLHGLLPAYQGTIGVSFPGYGQARTLGGILRLLGNKEHLESLHNKVMSNSTLRSYALVTEINDIPEKIIEHGVFQRVHTKGESDIRRMVKRHKERGTWNAELESAIRREYQKDLNYPYLRLKSSSTQQDSFLLFVNRHIKKFASATGQFNSYGLSDGEATVPMF